MFIICFKSCYTQKKRDCTIAVPLLEARALPYTRTSNTEAHADMYDNAHAEL